MGIRNLSKDVIFVVLPEELKINDELKTINEIISSKRDCDVIIDFSRVEIVTSSSISNLLILRRSLRESDRQLIFCNVAVPTKCIFKVAGLDTFFDFADDKFAALAAIDRAN